MFNKFLNGGFVTFVKPSRLTTHSYRRFVSYFFNVVIITFKPIIFIWINKPLIFIRIILKCSQCKKQFLIGTAVNVVRMKMLKSILNGNIHSVIGRQPFSLKIVKSIGSLPQFLKLFPQLRCVLPNKTRLCKHKLILISRLMILLFHRSKLSRMCRYIHPSAI